MPTTPRLGLRYPALTDAPNGPVGIQNLGLDVESWLNRAFPCTSTSRPASPTQGMLIYETDTGEWLGWTGAAWEVVGGGGEGGGGAQTVVADAQYSATGSQSIGHNSDVVVAFGAAQATTDYITRTPRGPGHQFELEIGGLWAISSTVRFTTSPNGGERRISLYSHAAPTEPVVSHGGHDGASILTFSITRRFPPGALLFVAAFQNSGSGRSIEQGVNGSWCRINFALVGR